MLKSVTAVYRFFGKDGIPADAAPELNKRLGGALSYYTRNAPHTVDRTYWDVFLDFAEASLDGKAK